MKSQFNFDPTQALTVLSCTLVVILTGCNGATGPGDASEGTTTSADTSVSGSVASAVGGALSTSEANGTQAAYFRTATPSFIAYLKNVMNPLPLAYADVLCPTFRSTAANCSASGSSMWLSYGDCSFSGPGSWNGVQELTMSSNTAQCGTFPNPGDSAVLYRQFVQGSGGNSPGSLTISADGLEATVDDASSNLANFDHDSINTISNSGYGMAVAFGANGTRTSLTVGHHISIPGVFDHSLTGTLTIAEQPGQSTRRISGGTITMYHNLLQVVGTSSFADVIHEDGCCYPISGTISTLFSQGNTEAPTTLGQLLIGKTERLTFTGCGTGTLQKTDGSVVHVTLTRCF